MLCIWGAVYELGQGSVQAQLLVMTGTARRQPTAVTHATRSAPVCAAMISAESGIASSGQSLRDASSWCIEWIWGPGELVRFGRLWV